MGHIKILLSTYNGEQYITEQIDSLLKQTYKNISILVRDDGSSDKTIELLDKWAGDGILEWYSGNNIGAAWSFMDLVKKSEKSDFYAFCDQDDVWDNDKLERAIYMLEKLPKERPALYCSSTRLVDKNLKPLDKIMANQKKERPSLGNALAKNIVTGCTAVFNYEAAEKIRNSTPKYIVMHDSWLYQVVSAFGNVIYDPIPSISYRQHENNVIGGRKSTYQKWKSRFQRALNGSNINIRSKVAKELYETYREELSLPERKIILKFANYKNNFKARLALFFDSRIYMNSFTDNIVFRILILFGKA